MEGFQPQETGLDKKYNTAAYKQAFAYALLKNPDDVFKAALTVFDNANDALKAAHRWPSDPEVLEFRKRLIEEKGAETFLPTKVNYLEAVWEKMHCPATEAKDFAKLAEIYGKARSFFPKSDPGQNQFNFVNKVLVVPSSGTDEEWRIKTEQQQRALQQQQQNLLSD